MDGIANNNDVNSTTNRSMGKPALKKRLKQNHKKKLDKNGHVTHWSAGLKTK